MAFNWKEACIGPDDHILDALRVIEKSATRAAFIVDARGLFRGLVTDGDIRRGLLAGHDMREAVSTIMNPSPLTCKPIDSPASVRGIMEAKAMLHMPVVENGILVNVLYLNDIGERVRLDNPVFLMAGGYGSRLQPLTDSCPKPLLKVGGKPILETILESFIESGFHRFYISTHYLPEMIHEYFGDGSLRGVTIEYTHEDDPLGTAGALGLLPDSLPELPMVVMNGDILTKVDFATLLDYHNRSGAAATLCVRDHEYQVPYGGVTAEDFRVKSMVEKPTYRYYVNAGIYVINPVVVQQVPDPQKIDMPELLAKQIEEGAEVATYPLDEYWLDIGRMNDFEKAQQDILGLFS